MSAENQNQDQDFETLQRMLKLKRHEQPPPRFFNDFSGHVNARIRAGGPGGKLSSFDDVVAQTPWLQRFWQSIEGRPAISGICAAGVCGLLLLGILLGDQTQNTIPSFAAGPPAETDKHASPLAAPPAAPLPALAGGSTKPTAVLPGNSLFTTPLGIQPVTASGLPPRLGTNGF